MYLNVIKKKKCRKCKQNAEKWDPLVPFSSELLCQHSREKGGKLILIRHGQSVWNRKPDHPDQLWRYAGSIDVPLSNVGIQEALEAGSDLSDLPIDLVFCSEMDRAKTTVSLALSCHRSKRTPIIQKSSPLVTPIFEGVHDFHPGEFVLPVYVTASLNERNFGKLQGVPSSKHTVEFDPDEIRKIRNDYNTKFPGKKGESSHDVFNRTIPCLQQFILPHLREGRNVLVSSHGFAIRTIIKYLDQMSDSEWNEQMNIEKSHPEQCKLLAPTGVPLIYQYDNGNFKKLSQTPRERTESLHRSSAAY